VTDPAVAAQKDSASVERKTGGSPFKDANARIAEKLAPRIMDIRNRRRPIDEEDLRTHAMHHAVRGRFFYNSDTFKHYIPMGRRAIERFVVRVVQSLIPNDQFFECYPGDEMSIAAGREAAANGAYMHWLLTRKVGIRKVANQLARCLLMYRRAILKTSVEVTDATVSMGRIKGRLKEVWPTARVVDPFSFYVWPETSPNLKDASLVFEDVLMPYAEYRQHVKDGQCDDILQSELTRPDFPYHWNQRLAVTGFAEPQMIAGDNTAPYGDGKQLAAGGKALPLETDVSLSECWFGSGDKLMTCWLVWNVNNGPRAVRFKQASYPSIESVYKMAVARPIPGETYSSTLANDIEPLQILLNDQFNQMEEARSVAGLPPIALDPNLISRTDSIVYGARKRWLVENPKEAIYPVQIPDTSKTSLAASQNTMGLINTIGGASPLAEGQPTRGLPRAGMAVQNLISLGLADITDVATIIETEILTPMMADLHRLTLAFVPPSQVMQIPGTQGYQAQSITVETIAGNWSFNWVGAQQLQAMTTKASQLLGFFANLSKVAPQLEQQGWAIKWGPFAKRVWRDALGERGVEDIVVPISELMKDPQMQEAQQIAQQLAAARAQQKIPPKVAVNIRGEIGMPEAEALASGQPVQPAPGSNPAAAAAGQPGAPAGPPNPAGPLPGGSDGNVQGGGANG
jgi:hypothetical protein